MSAILTSLNISGNPWHLCGLFELIYLGKFKPGDVPNNFYCGITNDPVRRASEHNVNGFIICKKMKNADLAKRAEYLLGRKGFDVGGQPGNGNEDSCYVYMYRKVPFVTVEH